VGPRIPGHKVLLSSASSYIRTLLLGCGGIPGTSSDTIFVDVACGAQALASLTESLYSRQLPVSLSGSHSVLDALRVASFLALSEAHEALLAFLRSNLRPGNVLRLASAAEAAGLPEARSCAVTYAAEHFEALQRSPRASGLLQLSRAALEELLSSSELRVEGELAVFRTLTVWLAASETRADADAEEEEEGNRATSTQTPPAVPPELLALIRLQHVPLEALYRTVACHPRMQSLYAKQAVVDAFAFHALQPPAVAPPADGGQRVEPSWPVDPQPPRRYGTVDGRTVRLNTVLRVREGEERVRALCESLPADNPIKWVARMKLTVGQTGVLCAKSRRGSLKLRFDQLTELPVERRDYWFPQECLTWP
jgi:hypothetical protein